MNCFCAIEPLTIYQPKGIRSFGVGKMRSLSLNYDDDCEGFPFLIENSYFSLKYVRIQNVWVVRFCLCGDDLPIVEVTSVILTNRSSNHVEVAQGSLTF